MRGICVKIISIFKFTKLILVSYKFTPWTRNKKLFRENHITCISSNKFHEDEIHVTTLYFNTEP